MIKREREVYEYIYNHPAHYKQYGRGFHGRSALDIFREELLNSKTALDVGCGYNDFIISLRKINRSPFFIGVDFACPGADILFDAQYIPFKDKSFDILTSFDVLEHIALENIESVILEFKRVSNQFIFSISYRKAYTSVPGVDNLHLTIRDERWWLDILGKHCVRIEKRGKFIYGVWNNNTCTGNRFLKVAHGIIKERAQNSDIKNRMICWMLYQSIRDRINHFKDIEGVIDYNYIFSIESTRWKLSIICAAICYLINIEDNFNKAYSICDKINQELYKDTGKMDINIDSFCNVVKLIFLHFILSKKLNLDNGTTVDDVIRRIKIHSDKINNQLFNSPWHWGTLYICALIQKYLLCVKLGKNDITINKELEKIISQTSNAYTPTTDCFKKIIL